MVWSMAILRKQVIAYTEQKHDCLCRTSHGSPGVSAVCYISARCAYAKVSQPWLMYRQVYTHYNVINNQV
jgi:hypothetical protein